MSLENPTEQSLHSIMIPRLSDYVADTWPLEEEAPQKKRRRLGEFVAHPLGRPHSLRPPTTVPEQQLREFVAKRSKKARRFVDKYEQARPGTKRKRKQNQFARDILLRQLQNYFVKHLDHYDILRKLVSGSGSKSLPSLRMLEFIITNPRRYKQFTEQDIRLWYKDKLSDFTKKHFDPFRRTTRFSFSVKGREKSPISTTIGQLNWSREVFLAGILKWATNPENRSRVKGDMQRVLQEQRLRKQRKLPPRRKKKNRVHHVQNKRGLIPLQFGC